MLLMACDQWQWSRYRADELRYRSYKLRYRPDKPGEQDSARAVVLFTLTLDYVDLALADWAGRERDLKNKRHFSSRKSVN